MIQQEVKIAHAYALGVVSLVIALFIPISFIVLTVFNSASLFPILIVLGVGIPLIAIITGVLGFIKSKKHNNNLAKSARILSITSIIIGVILVVFDLYTFIKTNSLIQ